MSAGSRETILIVEDDPGVAELQRRSLKRAGYDVVTAATADEALARVADGGIRLVLLDYRLPGGITGLDVHRQLKEEAHRLPVILVTAFSDEATVIEALRAGVRDFVSKSPAYLDFLPEAVERVLQQVRTEESLEVVRQELLQAQKLEAVGRLAGGIAHDFNNMLHVILGYSDAILDCLDASSPLRADAEEIRMAANRSAALTRQLLAFSRQQPADPQVIDLNATVSDLQKMLGRLIGADVEFVSRLEADPACVVADVGQIEQVVMNLVVNSRDAMPDGGRLIVTTGNLDAPAGSSRHRADLTAGSYVTLSVEDTGCGMDAATQARIFEPFFTTKAVGQGTGLGLATVYGIVRQSGGQIAVDSQPGRGARFIIYLPEAQAECSSTPTDTDCHPAARGSEVILVVEDQDAVRALVRRVLKQHGYVVLEARNSAEVPGVLPVGVTVDLLLADIVLAGQSGPELAEALQRTYTDLKVLLMSGYDGECVSNHGIHASGAALLHKPFSAGKLLENVRAILDGTSSATSEPCWSAES